MSPPARRSPGQSCERLALYACAAFALLFGCAADRSEVAQVLAAASRSAAASVPYQVHHPDVLDIKVASRPDLTGVQTVGTDGRVGLGALGRLRVDGHTGSEIAELVARAGRLSPADVSVRIA